MSYNLLSEPIRRFIRDKGWEQLRPIQVVAIERILKTDFNYILASRTASGKTEAAFLPILSKVDFSQPGVQVLYISPLIALINDQFFRIEELCKYLDVTVTKWHGEANRTLKVRLVKQPSGIVLITPESIEAMFVNKPYNVKHLFSKLRYVVIDEIHSFLGTDRGVQLKSLLSRLKQINQGSFSVIGLSATLGDFEEAKRFTGDKENTKVLLDRKVKEVEAVFRFFSGDEGELPVELIRELYHETKDNKVLVFPNSRGKVEEVAVKLRKIAERMKAHTNYFSHHSSIDRQVREYVEYFAKSNVRQNFCISCTSTLELGIDIGTVDKVVQIDSAHSIASLIQRVGRSGRKEGESSNLFVYSTNPWSLLQSLACWELFREGFIEPPNSVDQSYDILLHQLLSIVKGSSGIPVGTLIDLSKRNNAFAMIAVEEIHEIVNHLIKIDFFELIRSELIIGMEGEKVVNSKDFYTAFSSEENLKVINSGNVVGEIPYSNQVVEDQNILLAARIWKIVGIDERSKKVYVVTALDGKKPLFFGGPAQIHSRVREKMMDIVFSGTDYDYLDESGKTTLTALRNEFCPFNIKDFGKERPLLSGTNGVQLYTFSGTRVNNAISFLFKMAKLDQHLYEHESTFEIFRSESDFRKSLENFQPSDNEIDATLMDNTNLLSGISKWGVYLPSTFQVKLLKTKYYDFNGARRILKCQFIVNK